MQSIRLSKINVMVFDSDFNSIDTENVLISESELIEATTETSIGGVVVASSLSNLLVVKSIKLGIRAIITRECNIASHAANILRAANSKGKVIDWFYGLDIGIIRNYIGKKCLFTDDKLYIEGETLSFQLKNDNDKDLIFDIKSIATLNLTKNFVSYCFFPETRFSKFAFSLMKSSLEKEIKTWFLTEASVDLVDGVIEFRRAPSLTDINRFACSIYASRNYYLSMFENYSHIVESLRKNPWNFLNLCVNAERYYSTFLVLHRSYNILFDNFKKRIEEEIGQNAKFVYRELMQSKIDVWLSDEDNVLINKKVFLQDEPVAKIPDFSVEDDVMDSFERVKSLLKKLNLEDYYNINRRWLEMHSVIFVLKEWKFVIYKIIFTHIKVLIKENASLACLSNECISNMTKDEVIMLL